MAQENRGWGYRRIQCTIANLVSTGQQYDPRHAQTARDPPIDALSPLQKQSPKTRSQVRDALASHNAIQHTGPNRTSRGRGWPAAPRANSGAEVRSCVRDPNRLGVDESARAKMRELSAISAVLDATDRHAVIRGRHTIDKDTTGIEVPGHLTCQGGRAIREVLCFQEVSGATRRDRTGDLLITKFHIISYAIDSMIGETSLLLPYWA